MEWYSIGGRHFQVLLHNELKPKVSYGHMHDQSVMKFNEKSYKEGKSWLCLWMRSMVNRNFWWRNCLRFNLPLWRKISFLNPPFCFLSPLSIKYDDVYTFPVVGALNDLLNLSDPKTIWDGHKVFEIHRWS